jgi:Holliday junction DNA helicase RuvB
MVFHEDAQGDEQEFDRSLRPSSFGEFIGQNRIRENLNLAITAARSRKEPLDHVLFVGPPGLGKTTLSHLIAHGMGAGIAVTSGPVLGSPRDLMGTLTRLETCDVLFVDEIHRLPRSVEEYLYTAMEDHAIDVVLDQGPTGRSIRLTLSPFTLVGATTREGLLSAAFRARFGLVERLEPYPPVDIQEIVARAADRLKFPITADAASLVAERSRGVPRTALRILRRVRDVAQIQEKEQIDLTATEEGIERLGIDPLGLDQMDRKILRALIQRGEPTGLKTLAAIVEESEDTLEDVFEPHLIRCGLLSRTPRGRIATSRASEHLGMGRGRPDGLPFAN